jgi:hypothetical protein
VVKNKRSLIERATAILIKQFQMEQEITFEEWSKLPATDMDRWIELIMYIQSMPRLEMSKKGRRTYLSTLENKFMLLVKKIYLDQKKSYQYRESALLLYFKGLLALERLKGDPMDIGTIVNESWIIDRPTIVRIAEEAFSELNEE